MVWYNIPENEGLLSTSLPACLIITEKASLIRFLKFQNPSSKKILHFPLTDMGYRNR